MNIVLASDNVHKLTELKRIFGKHDLINVIPLRETEFDGEIVEDANTFEGNALKKAKTVCDALGTTVIADDSGLCVDALNGAPGVYSARYSGENPTSEKNIDKLLKALQNVAQERRTARFVSVICICFPDGRVKYFRGECEGLILSERHGTDGFGYDPVFYYPPLKKTFAELSPSEKDAVSHRGIAIGKLKDKIPELF